MRATCTAAAPTGFTPIAVTILLETPQDAEALRTLVSRNVTIPKLVAEKFYGAGNAGEASSDVYDLLAQLQSQLNDFGFTYPSPRR